MARKTIDVQITDPGRDAGKTFILTEMSADRLERMCWRAMLAMIRGGADIPDNLAQAGAEGFVMLGYQMLGGMSYDESVLLLDEMFGCVTIKIAPATPGMSPVIRPLFDGDIEELSTRIRLRKDLFWMHLGFFFAGAASG